jgi:hypothetical protein
MHITHCKPGHLLRVKINNLEAEVKDDIGQVFLKKDTIVTFLEHPTYFKRPDYWWARVLYNNQIFDICVGPDNWAWEDTFEIVEI